MWLQNEMSIGQVSKKNPWDQPILYFAYCCMNTVLESNISQNYWYKLGLYMYMCLAQSYLLLTVTNNSCIFLPVWLYIFFLLYSRVKCLQRIHPLSKRSLLCWSPLLASPIQSQYLYWLPGLFLVILLSFSLQFLNCFPLFSTTEWRV